MSALRDAVLTYARQFYNPMREGETLRGWFERARGAMMQNMSCASSLPFLVFMEAVVNEIDASAPPHANPAPPASLNEQRKQFDAEKKAAGWKGSDALPYDGDVD